MSYLHLLRSYHSQVRRISASSITQSRRFSSRVSSVQTWAIKLNVRKNMVKIYFSHVPSIGKYDHYPIAHASQFKLLTIQTNLLSHKYRHSWKTKTQNWYRIQEIKNPIRKTNNVPDAWSTQRHIKKPVKIFSIVVLWNLTHTLDKLNSHFIRKSLLKFTFL